MFERRLRQFGLDQYFVYVGDFFQKKMAKHLRKMVFDYLEGNLTDVDGNRIPDGPAVTRLRNHLHLLGGMSHFIQQQSPDGAWATDIELTLLAEILDVNFVVKFASTGTTTVLRASESKDQPTFSVINTNNTAWDAYVGGEKQRTLHDNNCGYNSIAENIRLITKPSLVSQPEPSQLSILQLQKQQEDKYFTKTVQQYKQNEQAHQASLERLKKTDIHQYNATVKQIDEDYQLALQIALADLPGPAAKASQPYIPPQSFFNQPKRLPEKAGREAKTSLIRTIK